jgi:hypothetical protein
VITARLPFGSDCGSAGAKPTPDRRRASRFPPCAIDDGLTVAGLMLGRPANEAAELTLIFAESGELPAQKLN